jgi:hypothetical protein
LFVRSVSPRRKRALLLGALPQAISGTLSLLRPLTLAQNGKPCSSGAPLRESLTVGKFCLIASRKPHRVASNSSLARGRQARRLCFSRSQHDSATEQCTGPGTVRMPHFQVSGSGTGQMRKRGRNGAVQCCYWTRYIILSDWAGRLKDQWDRARRRHIPIHCRHGGEPAGDIYIADESSRPCCASR